MGSMPSRSTSSDATASTGGTRSATERHRERMVTRTSSWLGAHSSHTVRPAGSSIALSSALPLVSLRRSASSMMITRCRPCAGLRCASSTSGRAVSARMKTPSVATTVTSGCSPRRVVVQSWQTPHPPVSHCRAAANARAAFERPDPGGPVSSQACVIADGSVIAARSTSTTGS